MDFIREKIFQKLKRESAFWSYSSPDKISDENLIEQTLINLDIDDIERLFLIFPEKKIKQVWEERLVKQEPYYHNLNIFLASVYFNIDSPKQYIKNKQKEVLNF
jgi:hypothetical protein